MVESGNVGDRHPGADCAHVATERQSAVLPEARDSLSDLDRGEDRKTQRKAEEGAHRDPLYVHALSQLTPPSAHPADRALFDNVPKRTDVLQDTGQQTL